MLNIIDDGQGQMCNRLLFQAQLLSSSYFRKYAIRYYGFKRYDGIAYDNSLLIQNVKLINSSFKYKSICALLMKIHKKLFKRDFARTFYVRNKQQAISAISWGGTECLLNEHEYLWYGWPFMDYEALENSTDELRKYFRFTDEIDKFASEFLSPYKTSKIVGIHMRRGDYKNWHGGKYYYENDVYKRILNEISKHNKEVTFVLFSNEELIESDWEVDNNKVIISRNSAVIDLCLMSKCDLIIGPPSSFSGWASYIGGKKRFLLDSYDKLFNEEESYVWLTETDGWGIPK